MTTASTEALPKQCLQLIKSVPTSQYDSCQYYHHRYTYMLNYYTITAIFTNCSVNSLVDV